MGLGAELGISEKENSQAWWTFLDSADLYQTVGHGGGVNPRVLWSRE